MAETGDGDDLAPFPSLGPGTDHDRRHAGHVHLVGMQHGKRNAGRAAGIDGIATRLENRKTGGSGEVMAGGDGVAAAVEGWAGGLHDDGAP